MGLVVGGMCAVIIHSQSPWDREYSPRALEGRSSNEQQPGAIGTAFGVS